MASVVDTSSDLSKDVSFEIKKRIKDKTIATYEVDTVKEEKTVATYKRIYSYYGADIIVATLVHKETKREVGLIGFDDEYLQNSFADVREYFQKKQAIILWLGSEEFPKYSYDCEKKAIFMFRKTIVDKFSEWTESHLFYNIK